MLYIKCLICMFYTMNLYFLSVKIETENQAYFLLTDVKKNWSILTQNTSLI